MMYVLFRVTCMHTIYTFYYYLSCLQRHVDGVAKIIYGTAEECDAFLAAVNGRIFLGRVVTAEVWDGTTRYKVEFIGRHFQDQ